MRKYLTFALIVVLAGGEASVVQGENLVSKSGESSRSAELDKRGTEESPLVVNEHPIQSKEEAAEEAHKDAEQNKVNVRTIDLTLAIAICAGLQFLGILGQIFVYWRQTKIMEATLTAISGQATTMATQAGHMEDQSKTLRESVAAAQKAADAAETSAKAAMGIAVPTLMLHKFSFIVEGIKDAAVFYRNPKAGLEVKNYGQSPAFLRKYSIGYSWQGDSAMEFAAYPFEDVVIDAGGSYEFQELELGVLKSPPPEVIDDLVRGGKHLVFSGWVSYRDVFGSPTKKLFLWRELVEYDPVALRLTVMDTSPAVVKLWTDPNED